MSIKVINKRDDKEIATIINAQEVSFNKLDIIVINDIEYIVKDKKVITSNVINDAHTVKEVLLYVYENSSLH